MIKFIEPVPRFWIRTDQTRYLLGLGDQYCSQGNRMNYTEMLTMSYFPPVDVCWTDGCLFITAQEIKYVALQQQILNPS